MLALANTINDPCCALPIYFYIQVKTVYILLLMVIICHLLVACMKEKSDEFAALTLLNSSKRSRCEELSLFVSVCT